MKDFWKIARKTLAFMLIFVGFALIGVLAHEAGHLIANNALGGTGKIFYNYTLTAGHMDWTALPEKYIWVVSLAGGIFAALFLFVFFWLPARLTPSRQDIYIEGAVTSSILANLFYTPTELMLYYGGIKLFEWMALTAYLLAVIMFGFLYFTKLVKWMGNHNNAKEKLRGRD